MRVSSPFFLPTPPHGVLRSIFVPLPSGSHLPDCPFLAGLAVLGMAALRLECTMHSQILRTRRRHKNEEGLSGLHSLVVSPQHPLGRNQYINNSTGIFLYSRRCECCNRRGMYSHRHELPQESGQILGKEFLENTFLYSRECEYRPASIRATTHYPGSFFLHVLVSYREV